jgi:hypothetical protein
MKFPVTDYSSERDNLTNFSVIYKFVYLVQGSF